MFTNESYSPHLVFENCVFKAGYYGESGSALFLNCVFRWNSNMNTTQSVDIEYCDKREGGIFGIFFKGERCKIIHSCISDAETRVHSSRMIVLFQIHQSAA